MKGFLKTIITIPVYVAIVIFVFLYDKIDGMKK